MIIPVRAGCDCTEYCMVELQGEVKHEGGMQQGFCIGTMSASSQDTDTVFLQVGYHRLEGKRVPLKQPIAMLRRRNNTTDEAAQSATGVQCQPEYYVHGQIRSKYIFKSRPKALISQVS